MRPQDLVKKKRDGQALTDAEIEFLINGYVQGRIPDYQMSALAMAIYFQGATRDETVALTRCMLHSGIVVDLQSVPGRKVDKHSTGGVGDKISLPLASAVAAAGVPVPMISGRGLGHTGGTLDKLESIPGFRVDLAVDEYRRILEQIGVCMIGQTADIAPADKRLYALRDVTATVESIPLITSSILSKKLAEGIDALVLDVKVGSGAFMKTPAQAEALARSLVEIGTMMGKETVALLTDMEQPLGNAVGNTLEVLESIDIMSGAGPQDVRELTVELGAYMALFGRAVDTLDAGREALARVLDTGAALKKFQRLVELQGGDPELIRHPDRFRRAARRQSITTEQSGYVQSIDSEAVGIAGMLLGAGRQRVDDRIDHDAGIVLAKKVGDRVAAGDELCRLEYNRDDQLDAAIAAVQGAYRIGPQPPAAAPLIKQVIRA